MESENSPRWENKDGVKACAKAYTNGVRVVFKNSVWEKIFGWCRAADTEISGMGLVKKDGGVFTVYDIFLPKQECSSASTEMDQGSLADLMIFLHKNKIPQDHMRCWMHTHYNFGVFWSQTDVDTIELLTGTAKDWMMSIVVNQAGDYKCRIDVMKPFRFAIDDIEVELEQPKINVDKYKKDIEKMVSRPTYSYGGAAYGQGMDGYGCARRNYEAWEPGSTWSEKEGRWIPPENKSDGPKQLAFDQAKRENAMSEADKAWGPRPLSKRERKLLKRCKRLTWDAVTKRYVDADKYMDKKAEQWAAIKKEVHSKQGVDEYDTGPHEFSECDNTRAYQSAFAPLIFWLNGVQISEKEAKDKGVPIVYYEQFKRGELTPIGAKK